MARAGRSSGPDPSRRSGRSWRGHPQPEADGGEPERPDRLTGAESRFWIPIPLARRQPEEGWGRNSDYGYEGAFEEDPVPWRPRVEPDPELGEAMLGGPVGADAIVDDEPDL